MRLAWKIGVGVVFVLLGLRFFPGRARPARTLDVIAHRGVHQTYGPGAGRHGCTAALMHPPTHRYLENTIASMEAAFDAGAHAIELDFHETSDGHVVVFHDWTIDCRTNGHGVTREQTLAYLKSLDIGWGYTADGGQTYPFRGEGVGLMPTLVEVLDRFPTQRFILNQKSGDRETLEVLTHVIGERSDLGRLHYWGVMPDVARELLPALGRTLHDRSAMKRCFTDYMLTFGIGALPDSCRNADIILPDEATRVLWGWPHRFLAKAERAGVRVYLWTEETPSAPIDGVMTDYIERLSR